LPWAEQTGQHHGEVAAFRRPPGEGEHPRVEQDVGRGEVAMDDATGVQVHQRPHDVECPGAHLRLFHASWGARSAKQWRQRKAWAGGWSLLPVGLGVAKRELLLQRDAVVLRNEEESI